MSRKGENFSPVLGDDDRVLELGRAGTIGGDDRPVVVPLLPLDRTEGQHRLDREDHAGFHDRVVGRGSVVVGDDQAGVEGLADAIVEVTETETTIRAHDLRVIDEVLVTNTVLIANAAAMQDPEKRRKIEQIDLLLQGALRAESLVCLKMNAPAAKLDAVLALLPSLNSPTVAPLQNGEWLSLETVVSTGIVRDLIPQLREAGAEGILEYALNKVI